MPDPRGPDTSPITSAIQGRKAREYPKLNEEKKKQNTKTDVMKLTHNPATRLKSILKIEIVTQEKNKHSSMWL